MLRQNEKPVIGVMPLWDENKNSFWMLPGYLEGISEAGGLPLTLPLTENMQDLKEVLEICDGLLFTGGHDVSPWVYGEERIPGCNACCEERDRMEILVLRMAIEKDKPVFGICRGIQLINAALGGTLYQNLPDQFPSVIEHHMSPPYDAVCHNVILENGSPLQKLLQTENLGVNSYHHQGVCRVAPDLKVMARSEDGLVEAVYRPESRFLWAVQWHPEFSYKVDPSSRQLFSALVQAAGKN